MPTPTQSNGSALARLKAHAAANSRTLASFAGLLVVWEMAVRLLGVKLYILPPPSVVVATLWAKWSTIGMAAWYTAQPMLIGYALAIVVGVLLALEPVMATVVGFVLLGEALGPREMAGILLVTIAAVATARGAEEETPVVPEAAAPVG